MVADAGVTRTIPALPNPFVPRSRLLSALDGTGDERVSLVCAPAGFGKTALLAHWARSTEAGAAVAWVDVHRQHADPGRLWRAVLDALTACPAVPPGGPLHELRHAASASGAAPGFGSAVVGALDRLPVRIILVLHDIHQLVAPAALKSLEPLVVARSAGLHVVLCSRWDPPLSLGELRSAGRLREIRADQLSFTAAETSALLRRSGLHLNRGQVATVQAGTGGRPADVCLTAAALNGAGEVLAEQEALACHLEAGPGPDRGVRLVHWWMAPARTPGRREDLRPHVHLDDAELRVLAHLPSPLTVQRIAGELRTPTGETQARMRAIYRKLGVSSRRTAVTAAYERGLMR